MKTSSIFWGVFLIVMGALFLLNNIGILTLTLDSVRQFWPLVLILFGVSLLVGNQVITRVMAVVSAIIVGLIIWSFLPFGKSYQYWSSRSKPISVTVESEGLSSSEGYTQSFTEGFNDSISFATLKLDVGAGEFEICDTTHELIEMNVESTFGKYTLKRTSSSEREFIDVRMKDATIKISDVGSNNGENNCKIRLNQKPVWDMDIDVGAAEANFDFSSYNVRKVKLDAGAASIRLKLGSLAEKTNVMIKTGVSHIEIDVPENVGCEVISRSGLSSFNHESLIAIGKSTYRSPNFDASQKKVFITLETGMSNIELNRFGAEDEPELAPPEPPSQQEPVSVPAAPKAP
ncbi:MAG: DUF5668 domain-containing protein [Chloroherpetonaceae bacterium]|nr:DUF5668 domain-containing protein [Chloroherpetonaceae bacterium]